MKFKRIAICLMLAGAVSAAPFQEPFYLMGKSGKKTLFAKVNEQMLSPGDRAAADKARLLGGNASHAGEVYFRKGVVSSANRYISTGRILVRFAEGSRVDLKAFAGANELVFVRSFGQGGSSAVFINESDSDDVTRSNALLGDSSVTSAAPDWVLPLKLY